MLVRLRLKSEIAARAALVDHRRGRRRNRPDAAREAGRVVARLGLEVSPATLGEKRILRYVADARRLVLRVGIGDLRKTRALELPPPMAMMQSAFAAFAAFTPFFTFAIVGFGLISE